MSEKLKQSSGLVDILTLHPSQLFINYDKLQKVKRSAAIENNINLKPLLVKQLQNKLILTDGHTRAYYYYFMGLKKVLVEWDDPWGSENLDFEMYRICVDWCIEEGLTSIKNLENRIISNDEYELLWLNRCKQLAKSLNNQKLQDPK